MDDKIIAVIASALFLTSSLTMLVVQRRSRAFDRKYHLDGK
jgi:hypothetical protein